MEKIYDYKVSIDENGIGSLMIQKDANTAFEELCDLGYIVDKPSNEVNELANAMLNKFDLVVMPELVSVWEDTLQNQKDDLKFVRTKMKSVLRELSSSTMSTAEKKEKLSIYQTMCSAAQQMVNASRVELGFASLDSVRKQIK